MKITLTTLMCLIYISVTAQNSNINFQNNLTWEQVKQKAKEENKYIFIDCYTTWCIPCKVMSSEIFTNADVAKLFNDNFVSVAMQFDKTKKDDEGIKKWYGDVEYLQGKYAINGYPTYLFFDPQENLVHYIIGASPNPEDFMLKVKDALNPATQINGLKLKFTAGERGSVFLQKLVVIAEHANDPQFQYDVINAYLQTQTNLLTEENLKFISLATQKSSDPGFHIVQYNSKKLDVIAGKGTSHEILKTVAFDEIVLPKLKVGGKKIIRGGGMIGYNGKLIKNVDWLPIKHDLDKAYPYLADEILCSSKLMYYRWLNDWPEFTSLVNEFIDKYSKKENAFKINSYARDIFLADADTACIKQALKWSNRILVGSNKADNNFLLTKANLLYKLGKKDEAIAIVTAVNKSPGEKFEDVPVLMDKMKKGEKTW